MAGLVAAGLIGPAWPLQATVFVLGVSNGAFSIAAIGAMMALASQGAPGQEGVRMGLWGAAQALAFGLGGVLGAGASDLSRQFIAAPGPAYAAVFALEGLLFIVAAGLAWRVAVPAPVQPAAPASVTSVAATAGRRPALSTTHDLGAAA
jgi:BCD family chlorophyll transporter-like MFS transporter